MSILPQAAVRRAAAALAFSFAAAAAAAQSHRSEPPDPRRVPAVLRLKGDPASEAVWMNGRWPADPVRDADGVVGSAPYLCRECAAAGRQVVGPETPRLPAVILGRDSAGAAAWAARLGGAPAAVFALRGLTLVVVAVDGAPCDLWPDEAARLRAWFPDLPARAETLTAHQRGHVLADRAAGLAAFAADLFDSGAASRPADGGPRAALLHFDDAAGARAAADFLAEPDAWILGGGRFGGAPFGVSYGKGDEASVRRRFEFATALALARGRAVDGGGAAPWMALGFAHYCESRVRARRGVDDLSETLPPDAVKGAALKPPSDRNAFVKDLVDRGEAGRFDALCASTERGLSTRSRLQAGSVTSFLLGVDPRRYGALFRLSAGIAGEAERPAAFERAVSAVYGVDAPTLHDAWRLWVLDR